MFIVTEYAALRIKSNKQTIKLIFHDGQVSGQQKSDTSTAIPSMCFGCSKEPPH